jgi:hypothetical protein
MKSLTLEQEKILAQKWEGAGRELERIRREALRGKEYNWAEADALLELGGYAGLPSRTTSGLVEMRRLFMEFRNRQKASGD